MPLAHQPEPEESAYALGEPVNRPAGPPELTPIAGRPNWWRDRKGNEKYIEPPEPEMKFPLIYTDPDFPPDFWSGI